jgi:hypothetical protein
MNFPRKVLAVAAATTGMALAPTIATAQANVTIDITIDVGGIIILACFSDATIELDSTDLANLFGASAANSDLGTADGSPFMPNVTTVNEAISVTATTDPAVTDATTSFTAASLTINNLCDVRGIFDPSTANVSATVPTTFAANTGVGEITSASGALVGGGAGTLTPGFGTPNIIGVQWTTVDFTAVEQSGTFSTGAFTVTASTT